MKKTDNYSVDRDIPQYLRALVQLRVRTGNLLNQAKKTPQANAGNGMSYLEAFEHFLDRLFEQYFEKFELRTDLERPEWCEMEELGVVQPKDVDELSFKQQKALFHKIAKLQEKLGHTTIESREWEDTEGVGGKSQAKKAGEKR